jgi:hypothetical protein
MTACGRKQPNAKERFAALKKLKPATPFWCAEMTANYDDRRLLPHPLGCAITNQATWPGRASLHIV